MTTPMRGVARARIPAGEAPCNSGNDLMTHRWATVRDIARLAGVSPSTVSNVFNDRGNFSEATRTRVMEAAKKLHYTPNALIRSLQQGTTRTIGVFTWRVVAEVCRSINTQVLQGVTEALARAHYDSLLYSLYPHEGTLGSPTYFLDGRVDGLITAPGGLSADGLAVLCEAGLPTVALYERDVPAAMGSVSIDNRTGVKEAVAYLAGLGHRHVAFVSPTYGYHFIERQEAFQAAADAHGLRVTLLTCPDKDDFHMVEFADALMPSPGSPTAVLAGYDKIALDLIDILTTRGIRIPDELSIIGFDDSPGAAISPGLTTIHQDARTVGSLAADMVIAMAQGDLAAARHLELPVSLVIRNSTTTPRR